jgi:hypothetical protein
MLHQQQKWQERQRRSYTQIPVQKEEYYVPFVM